MKQTQVEKVALRERIGPDKNITILVPEGPQSEAGAVFFKDHSSSRESTKADAIKAERAQLQEKSR